jgi:drug/metabolite transporter superfamily protein YnfA
MSNETGWWISAGSFALAAAGFLLPFWPLSVLGIALAAFTGRWMLAIALGLLLDIAYGAPVGQWHLLYIPFTLTALACIFGHYIASRYMRKRY